MLTSCANVRFRNVLFLDLRILQFHEFILQIEPTVDELADLFDLEAIQVPGNSALFLIAALLDQFIKSIVHSLNNLRYFWLITSALMT